MATRTSVPGLRWASFFLVALSLSIGWGIRGNFGHEYGAMIAGALSALAVCLLSGREDWRRRVPYFGMFGALGWAFGGSISYMQVIAYTHSGHLASQIYGFGALYLIGFLWGGLGGMGTALPAVLDDDRLHRLFRPLCWVLVGWVVLAFVDARWIERLVPSSGSRHENPFYWFDADWLPAVAALLALFLMDLWDRRREDAGRIVALLAGVAFVFFLVWVQSHIVLLVVAFLLGFRALAVLVEDKPESFHLYGLAVLLALAVGLYFLPTAFLRALVAALALAVYAQWDEETDAGHPLVLFAGAGALAGCIAQGVLTLLGLAGPLARLLVQYQGDTGTFAKDQLIANWPGFVFLIPEHLGWIVGLVVGISAYFYWYGGFRDGASLFVHMAAGGLIAFLLLPVLGSLFFGWVGGLRMTPPRGDSWAVILGVFVGGVVYLLRNGLAPVVYASLVSAFVGGVGFSGTAMLKLVMVRLGNPHVVSDPAVVERWAHWQSANWHSWLEQTYGFINGLGIALALGLLAVRVPRLSEPPERRRWTEIFAVAFVILGVTYLNIVKNVEVWTKTAVPTVMRAPLFKFIELSASTWFNVVYAFLAAAVIWLMTRHTRRPISAVPSSWLGRGQLVYLVFLWMMVVGNFERALVGFAAGRILTEGVIFVNAILAMVLVLTLPRESEPSFERPTRAFGPLLWKTLAAGIVCTILAVFFETGIVRGLYGDRPTGHASVQTRFGEKATWRTDPLLKGGQHR